MTTDVKPKVKKISEGMIEKHRAACVSRSRAYCLSKPRGATRKPYEILLP